MAHHAVFVSRDGQIQGILPTVVIPILHASFVKHFGSLPMPVGGSHQQRGGAQTCVRPWGGARGVPEGCVCHVRMYKVLARFFLHHPELRFLSNTPVLAHTLGYNPAPTLLPNSDNDK